MKIKIKSPPALIKVNYYKGMIKSKSQNYGNFYNFSPKKKLNPIIPKITKYSKNIPKGPKIYYYNNQSKINVKEKDNINNNNINLSIEKNKFNSFSKDFEKELFELVYPLKIKNISFRNNNELLHKHFSNKTIFKNKKNNNNDDLRYIEPKINVEEVLINQRKNRNYFQNKNLIRNYHLKRSLLLNKYDKIKNLTQNKFIKYCFSNSPRYDIIYN